MKKSKLGEIEVLKYKDHHGFTTYYLTDTQERYEAGLRNIFNKMHDWNAFDNWDEEYLDSQIKSEEKRLEEALKAEENNLGHLLNQPSKEIKKYLDNWKQMLKEVPIYKKALQGDMKSILFCMSEVQDSGLYGVTNWSHETIYDPLITKYERTKDEL